MVVGRRLALSMLGATWARRPIKAPFLETVTHKFKAVVSSLARAFPLQSKIISVVGSMQNV